MKCYAEILMKRLRNIPETCPIYKEAEELRERIVSEIHDILNPDVTGSIVEDIDSLLECVDRCRDIAGDLRDMCVERADEIGRLESELESCSA